MRSLNLKDCLKYFINSLRIFFILFFISKLVYANNAHNNADNKLLLDQFLKHNTITASFKQTIYGKKKNIITTGKFDIARPNKFIWQYDDGQKIISDAKKLYIYDSLLQEVTVSNLKFALGKSPALLLSGGNNLKNYYKIVSQNTNVMYDSVILYPLNNATQDHQNNINNAHFKQIVLFFNKHDHLLSHMDLLDSVDNKTTIEFFNMHFDITYSKTKFIFKIPDGVDIINQNS